MLALDILLQVLGAFYMFAGVVLARAVLTSRLVDTSIAAISGVPAPRSEGLKVRYSLLLAVATFVCGLGTTSLCDVVVYIFLATLALQALFLFWIAPRYIDGPDDGHSEGRRQSVNALAVFAAATALVAWATRLGRLQPVAETSLVSMLLSAAILLIFLCYVVWTYVRTSPDA